MNDMDKIFIGRLYKYVLHAEQQFISYNEY